VSLSPRFAPAHSYPTSPSNLAQLTYYTNFNVTSPPNAQYNFTKYPYSEALWWLFSAHYTSLCGGYAGGDAGPDYEFVGCTSKPLGWTVRGDDPFVVNFHAVNGSGVTQGDPFVPADFSTAKPAGLLIAGIVATILAAGGLVASSFSAAGRHRQPKPRDWGVAGLIAVCIASPPCGKD
jgi:hypothetical protein